MGNNQSPASNWSVDNWAYGNGPHATTIKDVLDGAQQIPEKYFGGETIENDPTIHQLQHDLLAFDETLKKFFRIGKSKSSVSDYSSVDGSDAYQTYGENHDYLEPISIIGIDSSTSSSQRFLYWRCGNCTMENKIGERVCQQCGQMETRF